LYRVSTVAVFLLTVTVIAGWGQAISRDDQAQASTAVRNAAAPTPKNALSTTSVRFGRVDFSGMLDGYYAINNNHPPSRFDTLYNFNDHSDELELNLLKLTLNRDPDPIGFRVDVGACRRSA
jgi:hypothetical protein